MWLHSTLLLRVPTNGAVKFVLQHHFSDDHDENPDGDEDDGNDDKIDNDDDIHIMMHVCLSRKIITSFTGLRIIMVLVGFHGFSRWFPGFSWFLVGFYGFSR